MNGPDQRAVELASRLAAVEARVAQACARAGRPRNDVVLIVVTKTFPAADVSRLADLGVGDVGEARHPEAGRKAAECAAAGYGDLRWHFVGAVQTNKAAAIAPYACMVHSVDRPRLVAALDRGAERAGRVLDCLVQVDLDPPDESRRGAGGGSRSGAVGQDVEELAEATASAASLRLRGVMAIAPLDGDPAAAFDRLAALAARVRERHPDADVLSAGMSDDLEPAVAAGATHLRVGRAILGDRPPPR